MTDIVRCYSCNGNSSFDWFWEAHQTMPDGKVWCVNAKRT